MAARGKLETVRWAGCGGGLGAWLHVDDGYAIGTNLDSRFGDALPGPLEVADMTGVAAGFYTVSRCTHNGVNIKVTTNGADTKVYRQVGGAWVLPSAASTFAGAVATYNGVLSFHDGTNATLIVFLGATTAFQYTVDDGATWTASNRAGNSKYGNFGATQQNGRTSTQVFYVRNPNQVYTSSSMVNGGAAADTGATIGDSSAQTYFTSVVEDTFGVMLCGMRNGMWSLDSAGNVFRVSRFVEDPPADAGGTGDRRNFEAYAILGGRVYYIVSGYEVWEYYNGNWNENAAPWHQAERNGCEIPRAHLPLNAITTCGGWLVLAMGLKDTTKRNFSFSPGGTTLLQNTIVASSELYVGAPRAVQGGTEIVWHGSLMTCTDSLRYMWFDAATGYLYLSSGDTELINVQEKRCIFSISYPLTTASGSIVTLNSGAVTIESGVISGDYPFDMVTPVNIKAVVRGAVSLAIKHRFVPDSDTTTAYSTLETFASGARAMYGTRFPRTLSFQTGRVQFVISGNGSTYGVLRSVELNLAPFARAKISAMAY